LEEEEEDLDYIDGTEEKVKLILLCTL